ncbi:MAG: hypothetical protein KAI47_18575, partial [Deltaproteobacteria bacterium]|nr:hypothetical protein [Deltaproteobacteria bacterium]
MSYNGRFGYIPSVVDDGTVDSWPPEAIRALRGEESRAALARQLGVTALTIYRWELPLSAPESRRPQKRLRERLQALGAERSGVRPRDIDDVPPSSEATRDLLGARVEKMAWQPGNQDAAASPVPGEVLGLASRIESFDPISAPPRSRSALDVGDRAALLPVFGDVAYAHWERAEEELVDLLAAGRLAVPGRALAQILMALVQLLGRNDVRGAFSTLLPILSAVASGELEGEIALRAHTVAALLFSTPTGQLFDAGRVRDHAARAARISTPHGCEDLCILAQIGQLRAALTLGDRALFSRHMVRHRASLAQAEQPVTRSLVSLLLAHSAYLDGYLGDAQERFSALAHETHALGFSTVEVEARGY